MASRIFFLGLVCLVVAALAAVGGVAGAKPTSVGVAPRPNVVVIETDDQTQAEMSVMPQTRALIGDHGTTFPNNFVNYSLCCPSRSTFLTGDYAHNHGVMSNQAPTGGFDKLDSTNTLPVWLQADGYYTGLIGKYLNGYETHRTDVPPLVPPGWSEWHGTTVTYTYYGEQLNENGVLVRYGKLSDNPDNPTDPQNYSTDVYTGKAVDFIDRRAPSKQPYFLWLTYNANHSGDPNADTGAGQPPYACDGTAKPAVQDLHAFDSEPLPTPPSFDEADVSDKPASIQDNAPFSAEDISDITRFYRCRRAALLDVDRGVASIVNALRATGELDNTILMFTSDNGFMHGEHRVKTGKVVPYEESIRVPLLVRGPGFPAHTMSDDLTVNADMTNTIVAATGATPGRSQDGYALQGFAEKPSRERGRAISIESNYFQGVRTERYIYVEYSGGPSAGQSELYDLDRDPFELQNQVSNPAYAPVLGAMKRLLGRIRGCAGAGCRPAIHLRAELSKRSGPRGCARRPVRAKLGGADLGQAREAEFYVSGKLVKDDRRRPFRDTLPFGKLAAKRSSAVRLRATLLDGRRMTLEQRIRACR